MGRLDEPPRDESGFRAHGSNQQFHRLLRHAVARPVTTAPSLAGASPTAAIILTPQGLRRKGPPGALLRKRPGGPFVVTGHKPPVPNMAWQVSLGEKPAIFVGKFPR
jgi:hypothetical protein